MAGTSSTLDLERDLTDKVAVVTGANSGIGYYVALGLAKRNAKVVLACRNAQKAAAARDQLRSTLAAEGIQANIDVKNLDTSSLASVRQLARELDRDYASLSLLVCNAGVGGMHPERSRPDGGLTEDGVEAVFATNYLGHDLLTRLLAADNGLLRRQPGSRVVNVSSVAHRWVTDKMPGIFTSSAQDPSAAGIYGRSKFAQIVATWEHARREKKSGRANPVTYWAAHPGAIASDIWRYDDAEQQQPLLQAVVGFLSKGVRSTFLSPELGARAPLFACLATSLPDDPGYVTPGIIESTGHGVAAFGCRFSKPDDSVCNYALGDELWTLSAQLAPSPN